MNLVVMPAIPVARNEAAYNALKPVMRTMNAAWVVPYAIDELRLSGKVFLVRGIPLATVMDKDTEKIKVKILGNYSALLRA